MLNPTPKDAVPYRTTKAHFVKAKDAWEAEPNSERKQQKARWCFFRIGRSDRLHALKDEHADDLAYEMLMQSRKDNKRLAIKGYNSPNSYGTSHFVILTHFGIYVRSGAGYNVYSPETGAMGYYALKAFSGTSKG